MPQLMSLLRDPYAANQQCDPSEVNRKHFSSPCPALARADPTSWCRQIPTAQGQQADKMHHKSQEEVRRVSAPLPNCSDPPKTEPGPAPLTVCRLLVTCFPRDLCSDEMLISPGPAGQRRRGKLRGARESCLLLKGLHSSKALV